MRPRALARPRSCVECRVTISSNACRIVLASVKTAEAPSIPLLGIFQCKLMHWSTQMGQVSLVVCRSGAVCLPVLIEQSTYCRGDGSKKFRPPKYSRDWMPLDTITRRCSQHARYVTVHPRRYECLTPEDCQPPCMYQLCSTGLGLRSLYARSFCSPLPLSRLTSPAPLRCPVLSRDGSNFEARVRVVIFHDI